MRYSSFIALRYLKAKQLSKSASFITNISIAGIGLGVAIVVIALTIFDGFNNAVTQKIIQMDSHIKITGFGGRRLKNSNNFVTNLKKQFPNKIKNIYPFILNQAIIKSEKQTDGISLHGITKTQMQSLSKYIISRVKSFDSSKSEKNFIIIGQKLAERLFVKVGDKVTLFALEKPEAPSDNNPPIIEKFVIGAIYESGMAEYDDLNVYFDINSAKKMFYLKDEVSGYNIQVNDVNKIKEITKEIRKFVHYPYYVRSIFKIHQNIFTWLALQKKPIPIILGLIIIVAVFNIIGTLLMIVLEKISSIGILQALGATKKQIVNIFLSEGIFISVIGIIIGNILALSLSLIQQNFNVIPLPESVYFLSSVPISINIFNYAIVSAAAFALSLLAAYLPSKIASNISPIDAIKFN